MHKMDDFDRLLVECLKDPEFKAEWDALQPEFERWRDSYRAQRARWKTRANGHVHKPIKIKMRNTYGKKARKQTHVVVKIVDRF